jgi:polysaccharide biosynthesis transport protein
MDWKTLEGVVRGVVRRRKDLALISIVAALIVTVPTAYLLSREPPRYRTSAVVLLEARPDRVPVFQEFTPFRALPIQMAILRSRSLAEAVLDGLPKASFQELVDNSYAGDHWQRLTNLYLRWRGMVPEPIDARRKALAELQYWRVTFDTRGDSSGIVTISAEASVPSVSVDIVNTYIEALMARTRTFNIDDARVSREFLEQQLADVKQTLQASEQSLQSFVSAHGGMRVPDRSKTTAEQLTKAEAALAEIATNRKMLQTRLDAFRELADTQKKLVTSARGSANAGATRTTSPEVQRLRTQLAQLESSLLELRMKFTEEHPRIRVVKDRIEELRRQIAEAVKETVVAGPAPAAVPAAERNSFAEQLVFVETDYHALTAQEEALRRQADGLRQSLKGLSAGEFENARLNRDVESQRNLYALLSDKLTAARIREQGEMRVVKVVDPPSFPIQTSNQKRLRALALALAAALCVGVAVPGTVEWIHRRIETEEDVERATGLPVLAVVPRVRAGHPSFISGVSENNRGMTEQFIFTEAFRTLRVAVELTTRGQPLRSILVTSSLAHEGKSTVVAALGFALAEAGRRVILADTDLLRPTLQRTMKVKTDRGLVDSLQSSDQPVERMLAPVSEGLWLAQRGESLPSRSRGLLAGSRLRELIVEMTTHADFVICDSSPVLLVSDNLLLAGSADGVIITAKAGTTAFRDLARTKALLEGAGARILGVVLNDMPATSLKSYYREYYDSYVMKKTKKA